MTLSDSCFDFMHGIAELAQQLADDAHYYGAPDYPIRYGIEVDALKQASLKVADYPMNPEATEDLIRLALSVLRFHDSYPGWPGYDERERQMRDLIRLFQSNVDDVERDEIASLIPDIARNDERGGAAASRLLTLMGRFGKPAFDIAIKILSDIASATAKKALGL